MSRLRFCFASIAIVVGILVSWAVPLRMPTVAAAGDINAYFDALVSRADFWKGFSLRPRVGQPITSPYYERQYEAPKDGGYQNSNSAPKYVTFDSVMDAGKVVVPAFISNTSLSTPLSAGDTRVYPVSVTSALVVGAQIKIDSEIMVITQRDSSEISPRGVTVARAQYGTSAAAHGAGAMVNAANNSLPNQMRFPLGTEDGNTYVFTWDTFFTSSYIGTGLAGNKTFQFTSGGDVIWLEVKTRMDGGSKNTKPPGFDPRIHVGGIDVRAYLGLNGDPNWLLTDGYVMGPGYSNNTPIESIANTFTIYPNRWTRYWVQLQQRANDYDYFDLWVADELQGPTLVYSRVPISVRPPDFSVQKFWIEFNDSAARLTAGRTTDFRDMVAYVRNIAALRNPGDIKPLLVRPVPGLVPVAGPNPPSNVRITP